MKKIHFFALALIPMSFNATAGDRGLFYVAGGASKSGASYSIGAGTDIDVLEISAINLGAVTGNGSAKFRGLSLIQNATPVKDFNLLFRVGFGKTTTTFANGFSVGRIGLRDGVIFGVGGQYQLNSHLAFRGELNRIAYAASADGKSTGMIYPVTLSALLIF